MGNRRRSANIDDESGDEDDVPLDHMIQTAKGKPTLSTRLEEQESDAHPDAASRGPNAFHPSADVPGPIISPNAAPLLPEVQPVSADANAEHAAAAAPQQRSATAVVQEALVAEPTANGSQGTTAVALASPPLQQQQQPHDQVPAGLVSPGNKQPGPSTSTAGVADTAGQVEEQQQQQPQPNEPLEGRPSQRLRARSGKQQSKPAPIDTEHVEGARAPSPPATETRNRRPVRAARQRSSPHQPPQQARGSKRGRHDSADEAAADAEGAAAGAKTKDEAAVAGTAQDGAAGSSGRQSQRRPAAAERKSGGKRAAETRAEEGEEDGKSAGQEDATPTPRGKRAKTEEPSHPAADKPPRGFGSAPVAEVHHAEQQRPSTRRHPPEAGDGAGALPADASPLLVKTERLKVLMDKFKAAYKEAEQAAAEIHAISIEPLWKGVTTRELSTSGAGKVMSRISKSTEPCIEEASNQCKRLVALWRGRLNSSNTNSTAAAAGSNAATAASAGPAKPQSAALQDKMTPTGRQAAAKGATAGAGPEGGAAARPPWGGGSGGAADAGAARARRPGGADTGSDPEAARAATTLQPKAQAAAAAHAGAPRGSNVLQLKSRRQSGGVGGSSSTTCDVCGSPVLLQPLLSGVHSTGEQDRDRAVVLLAQALMPLCPVDPLEAAQAIEQALHALHNRNNNGHNGQVTAQYQLHLRQLYNCLAADGGQDAAGGATTAPSVEGADELRQLLLEGALPAADFVQLSVAALGTPATAPPGGAALRA